MTPISIALVGLGAIARQQHLPVIAAHPGFRLAATASPKASIGEVPCFETLADLLASDVKIDAVALCTPPRPRHDLARQALTAGRHVLLEKPPAAGVAEIHSMVRAAHTAGVALFAAWHSRFAAGVAPAKSWLADKTVKQVRVQWLEDVRVWHPGQEWIWRASGMGVLDPGINALSILTEILPHPFRFSRGELSIPSNAESPCRGQLTYCDDTEAQIDVSLDFLHPGPARWDIEVITDRGVLALKQGGASLWIDTIEVLSAPDGEYFGVYEAFARCIAERRINVDPEPLIHVADALLLSRRLTTEALND